MLQGGRAPGPWQGVGTGLMLTLVVSVPTLVLAEDWHGRPLIDQGGSAWLVPAAVVAAAFLAGGGVAGRRRAQLGPAAARGLAVAVPAVLVLLAADGARRILLDPTLPMAVVAYWLEGAAAALALSVVGAVASGRFLGRSGQPRGAGAGAAARRN